MACDNFNRFYFCLWPTNMSNNIRLALALALTIAVAFPSAFPRIDFDFSSLCSQEFGVCGVWSSLGRI